MSMWKEALAAGGRAYYWNTQTQETRWEKPDDFDAPATPSTPAAAQHSQAEIDAAWRETATQQGKTYYFNSLTRATSWEAPPAYTGPPSNAQPPPSDFVAGPKQTREDDNYRPRDRRRDDRDHSLPQRPNFEGGRNGGMPWDQRQESSGFRGPMPAKTDEPEYSTYEQAEEAFFKMLRKHSISPDTTWEEALHQVIRERDYRALKDPKERKQAFEKYCHEVRAQEKGKEKERREKLREEFRKMLGTHDDIKHYTRWKTARSIIEREAVFKSAQDEDARRQMFDEYIIELKKKHAEDERAKHQSALQDLDALLQALIVDPDTKWSDAQQSITNNERFSRDDKFRALSNVDVLSAFDAHIKTLDRMANDAKQRDKRMHSRRERQARDRFRELLQQMQRQGKIKAGTRWQDFHPLIATDERYLNLIGTPGSSPLDLFWDMAEDEERKLRTARNDAYDVLEDKRYEMTMDTTLADFEKVMRSDPRTARMSDDDLPIVYERLMDKIRKRAEEDRAVTERHQRKAVDALRSVIKHLDPPVRVNDSYDDVVPRLQGYDEFQVLSDEKARKSAFEKHIRRLKEKEEDLERDRARRDGDRDRDRDRNSSRRDHERDRDRRHRTRTPEVDAYEADRRKAQEDRERQYRKASFGLTPPPPSRDRDRDRDRREGVREGRDENRYRRPHDRQGSMSIYDRERREREMERERSYISRADPRDKGSRTLDYGDEDAGVGSGGGQSSGSVRKRRDSEGSANGGGRRETKRPRRTRTKSPSAQPAPVSAEAEMTLTKEESPALQSGSEEGEIEEL